MPYLPTRLIRTWDGMGRETQAKKYGREREEVREREMPGKGGSAVSGQTLLESFGFGLIFSRFRICSLSYTLLALKIDRLP